MAAIDISIELTDAKGAFLINEHSRQSTRILRGFFLVSPCFFKQSNSDSALARRNRTVKRHIDNKARPLPSLVPREYRLPPKRSARSENAEREDVFRVFLRDSAIGRIN